MTYLSVRKPVLYRQVTRIKRTCYCRHQLVLLQLILMLKQYILDLVSIARDIFFSLNGPQKFSLRNKLLEIVMFPGKMSKISRKLFILFNERLIRDFGWIKNTFAGISVIVCGDLFQLPLVDYLTVLSDK